MGKPEEDYHPAMALRIELAGIAPQKAAALWGTPGVIQAMNEAFARAIATARSEGRMEREEQIAQMADALADLFDGHAMRCSDDLDIVEARGAESAVRKFADAIRKGEP